MTVADALALHQAGRWDEAERAYRAILAAEPRHPQALHFLGVLKAGQGDMAASAELIGRALALVEADPVAHFHFAEAVLALGRRDEAIAHYRRALALNPALIPAYARLGGVLIAAGRAADGVAVADAGLARADDADLHAARGDGLLALERESEALAAFERALARDRGHPGAAAGYARLAFAGGNAVTAFAVLDDAIAAQPGAVAPYITKAILLAETGQREAALAACHAALAADPNAADVYYNLGCLLLDGGAFAPAVAAFDSALTLRPNFAPAEYNRGFALEELGRRPEAIAACEQALRHDPGLGAAAGKLYFLRALDCDWRQRDADVARFERLARAGHAVDPFFLLSAGDDPALHLAAARKKAARKTAPRTSRPLNAKLKIAYLSPDFHDHPVAHHLLPVLQAHDRSRFEIVAVCLKTGPDSAIRQQLRASVDHFLEASGSSDGAIAALLRRHGIDIAVDLAGHTMGGRLGALALRPTPISVAWLGYAGSTGADYIDYILADPVLIPPADERFYSEKAVRLPCSYLARETTVPGPCPGRRDLGLPDNGFVFAGFNNAYKLTPSVFAVWMRLLKAVEGSVLWLTVGNDRAKANLGREAVARGVAAERLVFAPRRQSRADHLARLAAADLFLDSFPYGAHSTASDMLAAGVPVVTVAGRSFAARVAAGQLAALGLGDLVAPDLKVYERMALALAGDAVRRGALRHRLAAAAPAVFDPVRFCRGLESAYESMAARVCSGQPPAAFSVTLPQAAGTSL